MTAGDPGFFMKKNIRWQAGRPGLIRQPRLQQSNIPVRILREAGVFERMEQMGVQNGDTVSMYDLMFEYQD